MLIKDILEFNKKKYFGGAVQANWFYEDDKVADIASSYVFHGPKYHGVGQKETTNDNYKLNDTATYALTLLKKAKETESNRFNMTIAGYGTGKSHLSVALCALLSGHDDALRQMVVKSICSVDKNIGNEISEYSGKNLVLVLNGMRDFNLNSEILSTAKRALAQHGLPDDIFSELTKQYQQAIRFCKNTFESRKDSYTSHFAEADCSNLNQLDDVITALENADTKAFNAVNEVYKEFMGMYINVDADISASDVLTLLVNKYCKEQKIFDCIYILFDEFGRYIEFTANKPKIAGDSALQQIFEAIQNADGHIVFDGFIQSDLNSYIRRVENSGSNITRYVGRYENSDKFYLSSNFETILANLIEKTSEDKFKNIVEYNIDIAYEKYHRNIFFDLCSWAKPEIESKNVWINDKLYFDVIAKGCYPMHPVTVWFLANTSSWMQQRSTIAFTAEMFEAVSTKEITAKWIPFVYPTDIIGTGLFNEMQSSEEKGLVQSQYCMAYQSIITKLESKLDDKAITVLRAILIMNLLKFKIYDKTNCLSCIRICSGLSEDDIKTALSVLENEYCVITFDENVSRYDLNAEAHALFLFISYVLSVNSKRINIFENTVLLTKEMFINNYLTNDKKMLENIFKLRITLKTQTDDEQLEELLNEIEKTIYTEKCSELSKELNRLSEIADISYDVKKRLAVCNYKLKEGIKLNSDLYTPLSKAEKAIEASREKFNLINITSVLKKIVCCDIDTPIDESAAFYFSPVYCNRVNSVIEEASESSEFKKQYSKVVKRLADIGKKEYATMLKNRISAVLQNAELEQKYASTLSNAQRFISSISSTVSSLNFNSYASTVADIKGWIDTFKNADDMNEETKKYFLNKLSELSSSVAAQKDVLDKTITSVLSELQNPQLDETSMAERINKAISLSPDEESLLKLQKAKQLLEEYRHMKLNFAAKEIAELELDYKEKWQGTLCDSYVLNLIKTLKDNMSLKRNEWMRRNVIDIRVNIESMTVAQCLKWQSSVSELPDYLEESDLNELTELNRLITEKVKSQRIQGVVEMFNSLSSDEKAECLRMLNKKSVN